MWSLRTNYLSTNTLVIKTRSNRPHIGKCTFRADLIIPVAGAATADAATGDDPELRSYRDKTAMMRQSAKPTVKTLRRWFKAHKAAPDTCRAGWTRQQRGSRHVAFHRAEVRITLVDYGRRFANSFLDRIMFGDHHALIFMNDLWCDPELAPVCYYCKSLT